MAHVLEEKGPSEYAVKRISQDLKLLGHNKIILKSDNEASIIALKQAIKRRAEDSEIIMEESPVGESQSNGEVESTIKQVQGMFRTIKMSTESRIGDRIIRSHALIPWLVRHAASLITKYTKGEDGCTAYRRMKGKEFNSQIA